MRLPLIKDEINKIKENNDFCESINIENEELQFDIYYYRGICNIDFFNEHYYTKINKNNLTAPIKKARTAVIEHLFEYSDAKEIPDMSGYGPEATIFKAMFKTTGLYKSRTCEDAGFERALGIIRVFVRNAENAKQTVKRLWSYLKQSKALLKEELEQEQVQE